MGTKLVVGFADVTICGLVLAAKASGESTVGSEGCSLFSSLVNPCPHRIAFRRGEPSQALFVGDE